MKLVGYARVSTREQAEHGLGLDVQQRAIRAWCKANGHTLTNICSDEGLSGSNGIDDRSGLFDALVLLEEGAANGLVVRDLDRLARKLDIQEAILGKVWNLGRQVFTTVDGEVLEDDPDDPMRTAMRQMRGVFAQLDAGLIRKRLREGRKRKAEQGGFAYGVPPLGFVAGKGGVLKPDPDEQRAVQRIAELHKAGCSTRAIASTLKAEDIKTRRGGTWAAATIAAIIRELRATDRIVELHKQGTTSPVEIAATLNAEGVPLRHRTKYRRAWDDVAVAAILGRLEVTRSANQGQAKSDLHSAVLD